MLKRRVLSKPDGLEIELRCSLSGLFNLLPAADRAALDIDVIANTPKRFIKAFKEMTVGYGDDPKEILSKTFSVDESSVVILRGISFNSLCEHHILPFTGEVDIAYLPMAGCVVGLSKLARLVDCYAMRLQIQERMTNQIARALVEQPLRAEASCVVVRGLHSCMACRGVKKAGAEMVTSAMLGSFRDDAAQRAEVLSLMSS